MSASRSWDVQRRPRAEPVAPRKVTHQAPVRRTPAHKEPLKARRKKQRQTFRIVLLVSVLIFIAACMYGIWRPEVRVQSVHAEGPNAQAVEATAMRVLVGTYWYIFPRNSIFFYPEDEVRIQIQKEFPDISAVSVTRSSFSSLEVAGVSRITAFVWCGVAADVPSLDGHCYDTDAGGLVFKVADPALVASSTLRIFAPLNSVDPQTPLRSSVIGAEHIPQALQLVKAVRSLGVPVLAVALRGDEGDLWVTYDTRITYVLGHEAEAAILAESAFPTLNFKDGSIQYVDLRFAKKVYVKRYGE